MDKELRNISNSQYFSKVARCSFFSKEKRLLQKTITQSVRAEPKLEKHIDDMKQQLLKGFMGTNKKKRSESLATYIRSIGIR